MPTNNFLKPYLPLGFADQLLDLEIRYQEDQNLQVIQILCQMYRIAVDYYLEYDLKKAAFFQKRLNFLSLRSLNAPSVQRPQIPRQNLSKRIKTQISKFTECQKPYLQSLVEKSEKNHKKIKEYVKADLDKQQQIFKTRMLKRIKSTERL